MNKYNSTLQTTSYDFSQTDTTPESCVGVVKAIPLHKKNPTQHISDLWMLSKLPELQHVFLKSVTNQPKNIPVPLSNAQVPHPSPSRTQGSPDAHIMLHRPPAVSPEMPAPLSLPASAQHLTHRSPSHKAHQMPTLCSTAPQLSLQRCPPHSPSRRMLKHLAHRSPSHKAHQMPTACSTAPQLSLQRRPPHSPSR